MGDFEDLLLMSPVIAAIRSDGELDHVVSSTVNIVFVLYGNLMNIGSICTRLHTAGKTIFIHLDRIEGLKQDFEGITFIKEIALPYGVISTKPVSLKYAASLNLQTILRVFILDSLSLKSALKNLELCMPNAIEILPGIMPKIITTFSLLTNLPVIAGGLIETKKEANSILSSGALAVSTSSISLWD
ncbi:MAG: glycerol-3-phosphate responsive antiterminator [Cellulosilyticaceae bacterium]